MTGSSWTFDFTGYLLGGASLLYGLLSKQYRGRPIGLGRIVWIAVGSLLILGNIAQNIIELQDH
jgi:hypothetical protein